MSGHWILLNDVRVRCDRPEHGDREAPWMMAQCLGALYTPDGVVEEDDDLLTTME